jgi:hypothetical protein
MRSRPTKALTMLALLQACGGTASPSPVGNPPAPFNATGSAGTTAVAAAAGTMASAGPSKSDANPNPLSPTPAPVTPAAAGSTAAQPLQPVQPGQPKDPAPADAAPKLALDECDLHTKWGGDQYCIKPPPADKGFQIHVGPSNYDNPEPQYIMQPGDETVENISVTSGNEIDAFYYYRQYRMRPGSHHVILYSGGIGGKRLGGSQNLAKDNPDLGVIAPENQGVGMKLAANTPITVNMHYMNFTDKPSLKEVWINFWYRDAKDVTEPANELFSLVPMNVGPGQHVVIHSTCSITQPGRVVTLYGHRHANNIRFSAWRESGGKKDLIYDDYDWEDPLVLEFSTTVKNEPANPMAKTPGGWTGPLELLAGDKLTFECEIINMSDKTFRGANEAKDDEMCILVGDTVKTTVPGFCTSTTTPVN